MFDIGFSEVLLIFVIALVVLGPEKLPRAASQVGRWIGRARAMARQFKERVVRRSHRIDYEQIVANPSEPDKIFMKAIPIFQYPIEIIEDTAKGRAWTKMIRDQVAQEVARA